jgi:hypothetical protein
MNHDVAPDEPQYPPVEIPAEYWDTIAGGLSFNYSTVEWTYVQQKSEGNEPGAKK